MNPEQNESYARLKVWAAEVLRQWRRARTPSSLAHATFERMGEEALDNPDPARIKTAMHYLLIEEERRWQAEKRGGGRSTIPVDAAPEPVADTSGGNALIVRYLEALASDDPEAHAFILSYVDTENLARTAETMGYDVSYARILLRRALDILEDVAAEAPGA